MKEKGDSMCFVLRGARVIAEAGGFGVRDLARRVKEEGFPAVLENRVWKAEPGAVKDWCQRRYGNVCQ